MSPQEFVAAVRREVPDASAETVEAILVAANDLGAWWIRRALDGDRYTISGEPVAAGDAA